MKISFQNPTRGPLITVSLDDDAGATTAFVPAVADCAARVTSKHIIATEGTASIAGPLALVGMLFASGDTSPKPASPDPIYPAPSPGRHRCLLNPYDLSAECAAVRSQHASPPIDTADHVAPRVGVPLASAGGRKTEPVATTTETRLAVDLPTAATPTHDSIAAILEGNPPATGPWGMGWMHIPEMVASGETRYPRLEALVAHLLAGKTSPHIVERGPGMYSALSIALARHYRITVIEKIKNGYAPNYDSVPQAIRANITFLDVAQAPARADGFLTCSDALGRSNATLARQAGLLAYGSWRPRTTFPRSAPRGPHAVVCLSEAWPIRSGCLRRPKSLPGSSTVLAPGS